jgi:hypothetical protein
MRLLFVGNHRKRTALPYAAEVSLLTGFVILESSLAPSTSNIRAIAHSARTSHSPHPAALRTIESP